MKFIKLHLQFILLGFVIIGFIIGVSISLWISETYTPSFEWYNAIPEKNNYFAKQVYVSGEIRRPGVYTFEEGERINDVLERAGGFSENADTSFIASNLNLSKLLEDEEHIHVPSIAQNTSQVANDLSQPKNGLININTASLSELESLPGVGNVTAERIIQNRPFENTKDLLDISGIGEKTFGLYSDLITVK